jgi:Protein of unknown function (DUF3034)
MNFRLLGFAILSTFALAGPTVRAQSSFFGDQGKLLLTSGFSDLEGAGGGGLVPFAFITGYGTRDSFGGNAHFTDIELRDYRLYSFGAAAGLFDRVELSYTHQHLSITGTALDHLVVNQDVFGAKVNLLGDTLYDQDSWVPQVAAGVQFKHNDGISNAAAAGVPGLISPTQLGATSEHAADYYVVATKVFLAQSLVVNAVLRATKANQFGLLGFGGDRKGGYSVEPEGSIAYLLSRELAVGGEIRSAPRNLSVDNESAAWDIFAAWAPLKHLSFVAAYLNLGSILAPVTGVTRHQDGVYLSVQTGF